MASRKEGANIRKEEMYRGWFFFEEEKEWVSKLASRKEGANIRKEEMYRGWFSFEEEKEWVSKLVPILIKRRPNENGDWGERHETKRGN